MIKLLAAEFTIDAAEHDGDSRTLTAIALPFGVAARVSDGTEVIFEPGSLPTDGPAPKFMLDHDPEKPLGMVVARTSDDKEVIAQAQFARTILASEALSLAGPGNYYDAVSVGVEVTDYSYDNNGVMRVKSAIWKELSLVPFPAFKTAKVLSVSAEEPQEETPTTPTQEEETPIMETPNVEASTTPTTPIQFAAPRKVSASEYLSAAIRGDYSITAAENGTADVPGILPEPLVREVFDSLSNRRPFVSAVGTYAAPNAEVWNRRKITQHVDVDEQGAEFDNLASQALTIDKLAVTNKLVGGFLDLSEQVIDHSDPSMLNLVLNDMLKIYAKRTETLACAALVAGVTEEEEITDFTDGDEVLDALYDAAALIDGVIDELPTAIMLSPDMWANLGKMKNANGDRLFVQVGPSNAAGTMTPGSFQVAGLGLSAIVSNKFAAGTFIVGNPVGIELFEQNKGTVRVDQPANASVRLAVRGYFASLVIEPGAFVKFVDPA
jgi:HK97 family phage major capsid protein